MSDYHNEMICKSYLLQLERTVLTQKAEIERLRLLIRCETIQPPFDVADDCTTELAVELAQAKAESERLRSALDAISELVLQLPSGIEYDPDPDNPSPNDTFAFLGGLIMKEINLVTDLYNR